MNNKSKQEYEKNKRLKELESQKNSILDKISKAKTVEEVECYRRDYDSLNYRLKSAENRSNGLWGDQSPVNSLNTNTGKKPMMQN